VSLDVRENSSECSSMMSVTVWSHDYSSQDRKQPVPVAQGCNPSYLGG
jgi:hypothetical protein